MATDTRRKWIALVAIAAGFGWVSLPGGLGSTRDLALASLSDLSLVTLEGRPASLTALANGRPMVVNLWATWCPPCRREMPLLTAAQRREGGVVMVFVDQGEGAPTVRTYLAAEGLAPLNVLLDRGRALGQEAGTSALPVTLFFAADGRLTHSRIGEISEPALAVQLDKLRPRPPAATSVSPASP